MPSFGEMVDGWVEAVFGAKPAEHMVPSPAPAAGVTPPSPPPPPMPAAPAPVQAQAPAAPPQPPSPPAAQGTADLGTLSETYEAGKRGSEAVGTDNTGGWSYGKYQIATKTGTMKKFLAYVKEADPDVYKALDDAGGEAGATDHTDAFAKAWADAAKGTGFAALEHGFVSKTHYEPQAKTLADAGLDLTTRDKALRDVTWSVSVQHGPGAKVITTALDGIVAREEANNKKAGKSRTRQEILDAVPDSELIDAIYDERSATVEKDGKTVLKYFTKSTQGVQDSVAKRYKSERAAAQKELTADQAAAKPAAP